MSTNRADNTKKFFWLSKRVFLISFFALSFQGAFALDIASSKAELKKNMIVSEEAAASLTAEELRLQIFESTLLVVSQESLQMLALEELKLELSAGAQSAVVTEICSADFFE